MELEIWKHLFSTNWTGVKLCGVAVCLSFLRHWRRITDSVFGHIEKVIHLMTDILNNFKLIQLRNNLRKMLKVLTMISISVPAALILCGYMHRKVIIFGECYFFYNLQWRQAGKSISIAFSEGLPACLAPPSLTRHMKVILTLWHVLRRSSQ